MADFSDHGHDAPLESCVNLDFKLRLLLPESTPSGNFIGIENLMGEYLKTHSWSKKAYVLQLFLLCVISFGVSL